MSNLYEDFENKFQFSWFSAGWVDSELSPQAPIQQQVLPSKKDLLTLENELEVLKENIETISQKQLRLANLAKFYQV